MILIAPDSFKESFTALEVSSFIYQAMINEGISAENIRTIPLSDGGDGFTQSLFQQLKHRYEWVYCDSFDALGRPIKDRYLWNKDQKIALLEMASSCGLSRIAVHERDPFNTSTFGVGKTFLHALKKRAKKIVLGLGGSATNDGGSGFLQALGLKARDQQNRLIKRLTNSKLDQISRIDDSEIQILFKRHSPIIIGATDVQNLLLGNNGATHVFAQQKGANKTDVERLETSISMWDKLLSESNTSQNLATVAGSGAAGGLGYALLNLPKAELHSGFKTFINLCNMQNLINNVHIIITAEGKMDLQSLEGKAPFALMKFAKSQNQNITVVAISATETDFKAELKSAGFDLIYDLNSSKLDLKDAKKQTKKRMEQLIAQLVQSGILTA